MTKSECKPNTLQPTLQLGDQIDWDGDRKIVTHIEGDYAVWFGDKGHLIRGKKIARCHISKYSSNIRLLHRAKTS
jgi:hypothetical protein